MKARLIMAASIVDRDNAASLGDQNARSGNRRRIGQRGMKFRRAEAIYMEASSIAYRLPFVKSLILARP
jgi:hypothetical protein